MNFFPDKVKLNVAGLTPADLVANSPECSFHRGSGYIAYKELTIAGTGAEVNSNLFQVTGFVELTSLIGIFTNVTEVVTLTGFYWDLYDGTNSVEITDNGGVTLSGASLGSAVMRNAVATGAAVFANASQCRILEGATGPKIAVGLDLLQKVATNTYIRSRVTTGAATNCKIMFYVSWICRHAGSNVVAV